MDDGFGEFEETYCTALCVFSGYFAALGLIVKYEIVITFILRKLLLHQLLFLSDCLAIINHDTIKQFIQTLALVFDIQNLKDAKDLIFLIGQIKFEIDCQQNSFLSMRQEISQVHRYSYNLAVIQDMRVLVLRLEVLFLYDRIQLMISSKNKSSCAYAKTSKSKAKPEQPSKQPPQDLYHQKDQKQNIYDSLMNQLQAEDSTYIQKLLVKNEKKNTKKTSDDSNSQNKNPFSEKSNHQTAPSSIRNSTNNTPRKKVVDKFQESPPKKHQIQRPIKIKDQEYQSQKNLKNLLLQVQYLPCQSKIIQNNDFISDINNYLCQIRQSQPLLQKRPRIQDQRQFRKTIEVCDRQQLHAQEWNISTAKYNAVLGELQKALRKNDSLEAKLESRQDKIEEMKEVIKNMYYEIKYLKQELKQEKRQRAKYTEFIDDFSAEIHRIKSSSKEKREDSRSMKRNTYRPESYQYQSDSSFRKTKLKKHDEEKRHFNISHLVRQMNESTPLRKRGKLHRYKMSQGCFDTLQGEHQSTASIYKDCYYP